MRLLYGGSTGRFFYLAERVTRQVFEDCRILIPGSPPTSMLRTHLISDDDAFCLMNGVLLEKFIPRVPEFGSYKEFTEKRLMTYLTPIRCSGNTYVSDIQDEDRVVSSWRKTYSEW